MDDYDERLNKIGISCNTLLCVLTLRGFCQVMQLEISGFLPTIWGTLWHSLQELPDGKQIS